MASILDELAVLTGQQALNAQADEGLDPRTRDALDRNAQATLSRSWRKTRSVLSEYASLISGQGYEFNALSSPVDAVAHAKPALLPLFIQIIPPDYYPTGQTRTIEIFSPQTSDTQLTGFVERIRQRGFSTDPRNPVFTGGVTEVDRIVSTSPNVNQTVQVPELTPDDQVSQVRRTRDFLATTQQRYRDFQTGSRTAARDLEERTQPIVEDRAEIEDTPGKNAEIRRARKENISSDLESLRQQALKLLALPPVLMYVNPNALTTSKEFIVSDGNRTREGYTVEFWGEQQNKLSLSGEIGAFWTHGTSPSGQPTGGLTVRYRKGSFAYQNFLSLILAYRNNGYLYSQSEVTRIASVGSVNLFYDGTLYTGSFDTLSINHSEDKPFSLTYQIGFTVRYTQKLGTLTR